MFHNLRFMICVCRASHLGLLYLGSLIVLLVYSILYGVTAKEANWLGAITSAAIIILGLFLICLLVCRLAIYINVYVDNIDVILVLIYSLAFLVM